MDWDLTNTDRASQCRRLLAGLFCPLAIAMCGCQSLHPLPGMSWMGSKNKVASNSAADYPPPSAAQVPTPVRPQQANSSATSLAAANPMNPNIHGVASSVNARTMGNTPNGSLSLQNPITSIQVPAVGSTNLPSGPVTSGVPTSGVPYSQPAGSYPAPNPPLAQTANQFVQQRPYGSTPPVASPPVVASVAQNPTPMPTPQTPSAAPDAAAMENLAMASSFEPGVPHQMAANASPTSPGEDLRTSAFQTGETGEVVNIASEFPTQPTTTSPVAAVNYEQPQITEAAVAPPIATPAATVPPGALPPANMTQGTVNSLPSTYDKPAEPAAAWRPGSTSSYR